MLQMERQNEMIKARRKSKRRARFEESANVARQLLEEAEANKASHTQAHQQVKNQQEDLVCLINMVCFVKSIPMHYFKIARHTQSTIV